VRRTGHSKLASVSPLARLLWFIALGLFVTFAVDAAVEWNWF
jgi:hypothetical protein